MRPGGSVPLAVALVACSMPQLPSPVHESGRRLVAPPAEGRMAEDMIAVPAGTFVRGHDPPDRADEQPVHTVRLDAFAIDRTLVTRADFTRFVAATSHVTSAERLGFGVASKEGMDDWEWARVPRGSWRAPYLERDADTEAFLHGDAPVVMVSWHDAVAYCSHRGARLPTEAEWEYAMRAGATTRFPWGDEPTRDGALALNFWQGESHHQNLREDGFVYVSPVRAFPPNAWGIHDPVGNVWQWTADWYAPDTYARVAAAADTNGVAASPRGPDQGKARVLRGGSWWCGSCTCQGYGFYYRGKADPHAAFHNNGFRCVRWLPEEHASDESPRPRRDRGRRDHRPRGVRRDSATRSRVDLRGPGRTRSSRPSDADRLPSAAGRGRPA
jgi:sulfatase modifying factor 1